MKSLQEMQSKVVNDVPQRHTTQLGLHFKHAQHVRSEDNLTSPLLLGSLHGVMRSGESPFLGSLHGVMNGDRPHTDEPAPEELTGGRDVPVDYVKRPVGGTGQCAQKENMQLSPGHRLSDHWDLLGHVDGSATVNTQNGGLSMATSSSRASTWVQEYNYQKRNHTILANQQQQQQRQIDKGEPSTPPSGRACGATCAKVWNVVR